MSARATIRGYRVAFLFAVLLMSAVAGFTLWTDVRTSHDVAARFQEALDRAGLIGRIRVDALSLESAIEAHIRATDDSERQAADEVMEDILADVREASEAYTRSLPRDDTLGVWLRFNQACNRLAEQVRAAALLSNRQEAERARHHLVAQVRPVADEIDGLAGQLTQENADESRMLLSHLASLRARNLGLGVVVTALALLVSLVVGLHITSVLGRQDATIQEQLKELDRRNQELDAFTQRVAHDLMGPLSPLKGYLTLLRRSGAVKDPQALELVGLSESSAKRMGELIEALLRFCRSGTRGEPTVGELDTAVTTLLLEVSQTAAAQGVALERDVSAGVRVACPSQLLQLVAQNLLSNAVKYTAGRPDARVSVRVASEGGQAVLEVVDNGVGMSAETQGKLFQPFFRAPETREIPGHGLGLATTRRLVEAHEGTLHLRSALGEGTRVTVRFPLVAEAPPTLRRAG
ncbi:ATP-binding protein [Archangium primigenium]|uniref:ATP-binding protein n=1 Tax=[Archangium] primigenium TaxID=2792470 RepID=UPI00195E0196|nr:MCP four helix bundle domain-containing protein [Archangium primigenium]